MIATLVAASSASATNGYFRHGYGTQSKGMAGIAAPLPLSSLVVATNPAGLYYVGNRYDADLAAFSPRRSYTIDGSPSGYDGTFGLTPGKVSSDKKLFLIPSLSASWLVGDGNSVGIGMYGNGGMNTTYDTGTYHGSAPTGVDLSQLFVTGTLARELAPGHAVGISGILAYQWFEATGLEAFGMFSADATALSNNGKETSAGYGLRLGYLGEVIGGVRVGGSYQTRIIMGEFDKYSGLFAEAGDFDIPANWASGIAVAATPRLTLAAEVQQVLYSGTRSVGNPLDPAAFTQGVLLGMDNAPGFGWEDMTTIKLGGQLQARPDLALRAGYSYGEQPIPESEMMFNILSPGVIEQHVTAGFSKMVGEYEVSAALMHALSGTVDGPNPMEAPGQQSIELEMRQWEFELGLAF
jgi:long-chain fatty acid transport protein